MSKYLVTQSVTITYVKVIEAEGRIDALDIADDIDLDEWVEKDIECGDTMYVREFEEGDEDYE